MRARTLEEVAREAGLAAEELDRLRRYARLLAEEGIALGLVGPNEGARIVERHIADSLECLPYLPEGDSAFVDVGSGAGLPGVALAIALPNARATLLDSKQRSCEFLERTSRALRLEAQIVCARAEEYGRSRGRARFDVALSRALASVPVALEYCLPLLRVGGRVVALRGAPAGPRTELSPRALAALGAGALQWHPTSAARDSGHKTWILVVEKVSGTAAEYPRRPGLPVKHPLR